METKLFVKMELVLLMLFNVEFQFNVHKEFYVLINLVNHH